MERKVQESEEANKKVARELLEAQRSTEAKDKQIEGKQKEVNDYKAQFEALKQQLEEHKKELEDKNDDFFQHQMSLTNERRLTMQMEAKGQEKDKQIEELKKQIQTMLAQKQASSAQ